MSDYFVPVFTGGTGRSGTTIIANLLHRHPNIHTSSPREIRYLTDRRGLLDLNFGRPLTYETNWRELATRLKLDLRVLMGRDTRQNLFMKQMHRRWWNELGKKGNPRGLIQGITTDKLEEALDRFVRNHPSGANAASRKLFFELSTGQIKKPSVKYFVDSTPLNIQNADRISRLLPESLFINMVRDGRDVALSVTKERWGPNSPEEALDWWKARIESSAQALSKISKEKYLTLRLEDLIEREREETFRKIHLFLDLQENKEIRDYFEQILTSEKMSRGSWSKHVNDPKKFDAKYTEVLKSLASKGIEIERYY
jgi:Sulfotransferase family